MKLTTASFPTILDCHAMLQSVCGSVSVEIIEDFDQTQEFEDQRRLIIIISALREHPEVHLEASQASDISQFQGLVA